MAITAYGKFGSKYFPGMSGATDATGWIKHSKAKVSYLIKEPVYDPEDNHYPYYNRLVDRRDISIIDAMKDLNYLRKNKKIDVLAVRIELEGKTIAELTPSSLGDTNLSANRVIACLTRFFIDGRNPFLEELGAEYRDRPEE